MTTQLQQYAFGEARVFKITEIALNGGQPEQLFSGYWDPAVVAPHAAWLYPDNLQPDGLLKQSIHIWVVKTPEYTLLIDTGTGNHKPRPQPLFNQLNTDWLAQLALAGITPEAVDYVLTTHLHVDHVGWNTQWENGKWVPTFPNARYFFSQTESDHFAALLAAGDVNNPDVQIFADSVQPIIDAGLAEFVAPGGGEVLPGVRFISTPGHSADHMSVSIQWGDQEAFFAGDLMHHPLQVYYPEWNSIYCENPQQAQQSRLWALNYAARENLTWFSSHFASTSAGKVTVEDGHFSWRFI